MFGQSLLSGAFGTAPLVPDENFNTVLYAGENVSSKTVGGLNFQPDLVWVKSRQYGYMNVVADSVRGFGNDKMLITEFYGEEGSTDPNYANCQAYGYISANTASGFSVAEGTTNGSVVGVSSTVVASPYVSWNWKAGGAAISNTDGTTTSTISLNADAGFSIVKTSAAAGVINVGHGLGADIGLIILKGVDSADWWQVWHKDVGTGKYLSLNNDAGVTTRANSFSTVNSTIFENDWTGGAVIWIAYCWKSIPGYSLIGSYTGTGSSTNTPIIYTGFEPAWIMVKRTDDVGNWNIQDNKRNTTNPRDSILQVNDDDGQYTYSDYSINFYNDGFQIVGNPVHTNWNSENGKYIFMCFAS